jgi:type 1 glutamine amidotransferase
VSWAKRHGAGRVFYTGLGDWEPVWKDRGFQTHLIEGIRWTMGLSK